jgi:hypothetical protein
MFDEIRRFALAGGSENFPAVGSLNIICIKKPYHQNIHVYYCIHHHSKNILYRVKIPGFFKKTNIHTLW